MGKGEAPVSEATVEQVLDPRTMQVLGKFLKRGLFASTSGGTKLEQETMEADHAHKKPREASKLKTYETQKKSSDWHGKHSLGRFRILQTLKLPGVVIHNNRVSSSVSCSG